MFFLEKVKTRKSCLPDGTICEKLRITITAQDINLARSFK
jgi:hypothetical protein